MKRAIALALTFACSTALACAPMASTGTVQAADGPARATDTTRARMAQMWPMRTEVHVDLWLHGFALLDRDTASLVPLFRRDYREEVRVAKTRVDAYTNLDLNVDRLQPRLQANPALINAQFLALYFGSLDDLRRAIDGFLAAEGDPRRAPNETMSRVIATFRGVFPAAADREWLRMFSTSLWNEHETFYRAWWTEQQRARTATLAHTDSLWQTHVRPRMQPFLNNAQVRTGDIFLSPSLSGEGRAAFGVAGQNMVAVPFPADIARTHEPIYVFAHEVVGQVAAAAVSDNITPAQRRDGLEDRYNAAGLVVGGAQLLRHTMPELVDGYTRYYLGIARSNRAPGTDPSVTLAEVFGLPPVMREAIDRQIEIVLGGI